METTQLPTFVAMVQVMVDSPVSVEAHVRPLPNGSMRCMRTDGQGYEFLASPEQVAVGSATQAQTPLTELLTELEVGHAQSCATDTNAATHKFYECRDFAPVDEAHDDVQEAYEAMRTLAGRLAEVPARLRRAADELEEAEALFAKGGPRRTQNAHGLQESAWLYIRQAELTVAAAR